MKNEFLPLPDLDSVTEHLNYDAETGVLTWRISGKGRRKGRPAGSLHKATGFIDIGWFGEVYRAHRLAWLIMTGEEPEHEVGHLNGNLSDNRWANLVADHSATARRQRSSKKAPASCPYKGVSRSREGRWRTQLMVNAVPMWLGDYSTAEEAARVYDAKVRELVGSHGFQNFPEPKQP